VPKTKYDIKKESDMSCHLISTFMNQVQEMLFWEPLASFIMFPKQVS